jgi:hypothetical protein
MSTAGIISNIAERVYRSGYRSTARRRLVPAPALPAQLIATRLCVI